MRRMTFALLVLLPWPIGCSNGEDPSCQDSDCVNPPGDTCVDGETLRVYDAQGTCNPDSGSCDYDYTDQSCEQRCSDGQCVIDDPCSGVVCDQPPDNECLDDSVLRIYDAQGECVPVDGSCDYPFNDRTCENSCQDGRCVGEDLCAEVTCDQPPASRCADEDNLEEFQPIGTCDPDTGLCDYESTQRACPDGCVLDECLDLGGDFALVIPAGARACSAKRSTWDVFGDYLTRMRVTFREGVVLLPPDEESFLRNWIEAIEFGPERILFESLGDGTFTRNAAGDRTEFQFVQSFTDGQDTYTLTYDVWFDPASPDDKIRVFDESYLTPPMTYPPAVLSLMVANQADERWGLITCRFDHYLPLLHRVQTEDGAELELEERHLPSPDCMMACPTALKRAAFRLGQDDRQVTDFFRLGFVDGQHNWHEKFVVAFDQPVLDAHALHFYPFDNQAPQQQIDYLDQQLNVISSSPVESHMTYEMWAPFNPESLPVSNCHEYCRDYLSAEGCQAVCPIEGQQLAGRCLTAGDWPPTGDWSELTCVQDFDTCTQAGRPYVQCCCERVATEW